MDVYIVFAPVPFTFNVLLLVEVEVYDIFNKIVAPVYKLNPSHVPSFAVVAADVVQVPYQILFFLSFKALLIILFCTGLVEVADKALSIVIELVGAYSLVVVEPTLIEAISLPVVNVGVTVTFAPISLAVIVCADEPS